VIASLFAVAEPSKVPFFIAGGVLVVWAVALSALGLTRPEFPYSPRGARAVMALSFLLMVVAMVAAVATDP
jgi:hypothetical protein